MSTHNERRWRSVTIDAVPAGFYRRHPERERRPVNVLIDRTWWNSLTRQLLDADRVRRAGYRGSDVPMWKRHSERQAILAAVRFSVYCTIQGQPHQDTEL